MDSFLIWRLKQCVETIPANLILDKQKYECYYVLIIYESSTVLLKKHNIMLKLTYTNNIYTIIIYQ